MAANALLTLVALGACFVWARRCTDALVEPLPASILISSGAILSLAAILFRGSHADDDPSHRRPRLVLWAAVTAVVVTAAGALWLPASPAAGLVGLWGLVALEEGWCWERVLRGARVRAAASIEPVAPNPTATLAEMPVAAMREPLQEDRENVSQYLVRHRTEEAGETLDGWVRAAFVPTQRHAIAHVAICPPFEQTPRCYAEISDGPNGEVKIAQVLPYGVRFEIKLDEPAAEAVSVTVEFAIQEQGPVEGEGEEASEA